MKKVILVNLLFCFCIFAGQYKTIETNQVRVVFEDGMEEEAKIVASNMEKLKPYYENGNKKLLKKIPVTLKKDSAQSTAYFRPAPNKLEFVTSPMLDNELGATPWLIDLSIHEYRHYTQYELATDNRGSKSIYILGGENLTGAVAQVMIPAWIWEGDAIYYETKLSNSGRGRTPSFLKKYRALLEENKEYSYETAKNGSYKDYIPNHYYLGYTLVSYGYEKYGDKFWDDIIKMVGEGKKDKNSKNPYVPLSNALKAKTGLNSKAFYKEALKYYEDKFKVDKKVTYETLNNKTDIPTSYYYPNETNEGIISLKTSYNETPSLYRLKNGVEEKLLSFGNLEYYAVRDNKVIWSEIEPNPINPKKSYSNIKIYDLKTKKREDLTEKSAYFFPSLSRDKQFIAVIENKGTETTKIHILDNKGNFIKELPNSKNYQYSSIDWSEDSKELIVSLRDKDGKMGLISINLENFSEKEFIPFNDYLIGTVNVIGDNVYFSGSFDSVDNVYRFNKTNDKIYKLTSSNIGTLGGTVIDGELYFSEYTANGYNLNKSKDIVGEEIAPKSLLESEKLNTNNLKETDLNLVVNRENKEYSVKNYNYLKYLINIHSWTFAGLGDIATINLMSTNELEDFNALLSYEGNDTKLTDKLNLSGNWSRYWPNINFQYGKEWGIKDENEKIGAGLSFPLYFSKNEYLRKSNLSFTYLNFLNEDTTQYVVEGNFLNSKHIAYKDLLSDNSQNLSFSYKTDSEESNKLNLSLGLTTKGLFENDGFSYGLVYEKDKGDLKHIEDTVISRGYDEKNYDVALKNSFDYEFPISYPDTGKFGLYLNRIRGNVFYDTTKLDEKNNYSSLGTKLSLDTKIFTLRNAEFTAQYSYLLEEKESKFKFGFKLKF